MKTLMSCLQNYQLEFNASDDLGKVLKNWNPHLEISTTDGSLRYSISIQDAKVIDISERSADSDKDHSIKIEGSEEILMEIFTGVTNPAEAVLNGDLFVFASDMDKIKLDAISLIIWGL